MTQWLALFEHCGESHVVAVTLCYVVLACKHLLQLYIQFSLLFHIETNGSCAIFGPNAIGFDSRKKVLFCEFDFVIEVTGHDSKVCAKCDGHELPVEEASTNSTLELIILDVKIEFHAKRMRILLVHLIALLKIS